MSNALLIIADLLALICMAIGLFFMLVGAIGTVRMPDAYNRLHAATKCSTLGLLGLLLAAVFHLGDVGVLVRAVLTMLFVFVSNPVGAHLLAKAALAVKTPQWDGTLSDEHAEHATPADTGNAPQAHPGE
ncbi:monovalent cation/H(+) antiporter subunit G [Phycisphaerales bacterium AB-hyl4]|uniref:Monovalent cation/H(+) antiporter subunit G n=1 Tax=Natronomicrosphaera hydrolytica TaxID=3242702 RepID=A0ABV4UB73_9BACT